MDVSVRNTKIEFLDDHPHSKYLVISWMWVNINMVSYACQLMQGAQPELMLMDFIWLEFYFDFIYEFNVFDYNFFS